MKSSPKRSPKRCRSAFTLVEIVLAMGVISFAMVALLGLLSIGCSGLSQSVDISTESQIVQGLDAELSNLDYSKLTSPGSGYFSTSGSYAATFPRMYDSDGTLLAEGGTATANGATVYVVTVTGTVGTLPTNSNSPPTAVVNSATNSMQVSFIVGNQLQRSGTSLSGWLTSATTAIATGTTVPGDVYTVWAVNNGR